MTPHSFKFMLRTHSNSCSAERIVSSESDHPFNPSSSPRSPWAPRLLPPPLWSWRSARPARTPSRGRPDASYCQSPCCRPRPTRPWRHKTQVTSASRVRRTQKDRLIPGARSPLISLKVRAAAGWIPRVKTRQGTRRWTVAVITGGEWRFLFHSTCAALPRKSPLLLPFLEQDHGGHLTRRPKRVLNGSVWCIHLREQSFRVQSSGSGVQGSWFRVQGRGFMIQGSGFNDDDTCTGLLYWRGIHLCKQIIMDTHTGGVVFILSTDVSRF